MRILKTVQSYFPFQERGGTAFKVRAIARGLARRGHDLTILTADLGIRERQSDNGFVRCEWGWRFVEDGVETIYLPTIARYRALTVNPGVMRFCAASLRRFDLVHIYGMYDLLGPAVGHSCRRERIPYVLEPMGMYRPIVRNLALKKLHHRLFGARLAARARFVIATSEQEQRELATAGIDLGRIALRRNGVDVPGNPPARGEFRIKWNLRPDTKVILFLGRIVSKKRPDLLIQAFADWRLRSSLAQNSVLVIAGPDEGNRYRSRLKSLVQSLGLCDNVFFVGPLYENEKWRAYRDADVFVLPSENENFGNTAAEAVACGTPVIVTDCCGIASFIKAAGLIVEPDRTQIAHALEEILEDAGLNQRCRLACAEVAGRLSWDAPLAELEELYQQLVSAPLPRESVA